MRSRLMQPSHAKIATCRSYRVKTGLRIENTIFACKEIGT